MGWTMLLRVAALAIALNLCSCAVGSLFNGNTLRRIHRAVGSVEKTVGRDAGAERLKGSQSLLEKRNQWTKGPIDSRNQWTKSPLESRNQWTKSPLESRNQWTKSPLESRNQWTKSPLESRNQWTKSPLESRNQWTKSPLLLNLNHLNKKPQDTSADVKASVDAGACSSSYPTVTLAAGDVATFTSPGYPSNYPSNTDCGWVFTTAAPNVIDIECDDVALNSGDSITFEDGSGGQIAAYSGPTITPISSFSTGENTVKAIFSSDRRRSARGVHCYATAVDTGSATTTQSPPDTEAPPVGSTDCLCGKKLNSRIVGGTEASLNEYPWQVGMVTQRSDGSWFNFCGGSLISDEWIVTAAHCLSVSYVMIGEYDYSTSGPPAEVKNVLQTIRHPSYQSRTNDYDIALLRIDPIDFSVKTTVRPICLPDDLTEDYTGQTATITGWGSTSSGGTIVDVLREVDIPVISNSQCSSKYGKRYPITARMMCAGTPTGGLDSCQGDSGGPMVVPDGANYELVGVVSWGIGCALPQYPGVYTRVTEVTNWITANTDPSGYCPRA